jgi:HK97 family phage prohead protease
MLTTGTKKMRTIEHREFGLTDIKLATDSTKGVFSGYGAVFGNLDAYGEVIQRGAFKKSLREWEALGKLPPMLLQHGGGIFGGGADDKTPIGKWDHMEENAKGLRVEGHLFALGTDRGQYIVEGLKEGVLDGLSIGFLTRQAITGTKPDEPRRTLTDIDLKEVSIVTFPANPKARVTGVKSQLTRDEIRELEAALCDTGLSRRQAATAVSAFKAFLLRDAGVPTNLAGDQQVPAQPATLADVLRTARKVRAGMLGSRRSA